MIRVLFLFAFVAVARGFHIAKPIASPARSRITILNAENDKQWEFPNLFQELNDIVSNWDDVIDDFMFKRMGNGELFYGKRKYKPSNKPNMDGKYSGMGMSDSTKIDVARERKEEKLERRRQQQQERL